MSRWLKMALAETGMAAPVPIVPIAPKVPTGRPIGSKDAVGTSPTIADRQAHHDERAAIREFDGEFPRAEAKSPALIETTALGPRASGVTLLGRHREFQPARAMHSEQSYVGDGQWAITR